MKNYCRIVLVISIFFLLHANALAADFTVAQNGNWNIGTTWGGACTSSCVAGTDYPGASDNAYITILTQVNLTQNESVNDLHILNRAILVAGSYTLNVAGNWTNDGGTFHANTGTVSLSNATHVISGENTFYNLISSVTSAISWFLGGEATTTIVHNFSLIGATSTHPLINVATSSGQMISSVRMGGPLLSGPTEFNIPYGIGIDSSNNIYVADNYNNRVQKFNSAGTYQSQFGSYGTYGGRFIGPVAITFDNSGNIYVADNGGHRVEKFNSSGVFQLQFGEVGTDNGQLSFPYGIAVDNSGNVYVANSNDARIEVYDSAGNFINNFGGFGGGDGQFDTPVGVALDSSGNIFVVDYGNDRIQKFNSAGVYQSQFGGHGVGNGQFDHPFGIFIDKNHSDAIYITEYTNARVQKFNAAGTYQSQFGTFGSGDGQFQFPTSIALDSTGNIFVMDDYNDRVQKFNSAGTYVSQFGNSTYVNGQLYGPDYIAEDFSGNTYVDDGDGSTVQKIVKFNSSGNYVSDFATLGSGDGQLGGPSAIGIHNSGNIYVIDISNNRIEKFNSSGVYQSQLSGGPNSTTELSFPEGSAIGQNGNVYIVDSTDNKVRIYTSTGAYVSQFGSAGSGNGQFNFPQGIAISTTTGAVYVVDTNNNRVQKFNSAGTYQSQFGSVGVTDGKFESPYGVAIDFSGNVYVADTLNDRVQKFNSTGTFVSKFGTTGTGNGQLDNPVYLTFDSTGNIFVVDNNNHRIQKFNSAGTYVSQFGSEGSGDGQFEFPYGIALDSSNNIYVADGVGGRIEKFNSSGTFISTLGSGPGTGSGYFSSPNSISISTSTGDIYIVDTGNARVERFNSGGTLQNMWGKPYSGDGEFSNANSINFDSSGNIYIADTANNRIEKFNSSLSYQSQFGNSGTQAGIIIGLGGIAMDSSGNFYATDYTDNVVRKYNSSGVYQSQFGTAGTSPGQFNAPTLIISDKYNNLYIFNSADNRLEKYNSSGTFLTSVDSFDSGLIALFGGMTYATSTDSLYISDKTNKWVFKYTTPSVWNMNTTGATSASSSNINVLNSHSYNSSSPISCYNCSDFGGNTNWTFVTAPTVTTDAASLVTDTTVTLNGTINTTGSENPSLRGFGYGTSVVYTATTSSSGSFGTGAFTRNLTSLTCATTYHFRAFTTNGAGVAYGSDGTFTTSACSVGGGDGGDTGGEGGGGSVEAGSGNSSNSSIASGGGGGGALSINSLQSPTPSPEAEIANPVSVENIPEDNLSTNEVIDKHSTPDSQPAVETKTSSNIFTSLFSAIKNSLVVSLDIIKSGAVATAGAVAGILVISLEPLTIPTSASEIKILILRLQALFLSAFGTKKKSRSWGTVYDSVTKQPVDPAYVTIKNTAGKEIASSITDLDGRFGFLVPPGIYTIEAQKSNYSFPSKKLNGKKSDELYNDLYFGDQIEIRKTGEVVAKNIPMDALAFDWNEFAKRKNKLTTFYSKWDLPVRRISKILFVLGFIVSLISLFTVHEPYNFIVFGVYILISVLRLIGINRKLSGSVQDQDGRPLSFGVLRIYRYNTSDEIMSRVLDKYGRYYALVPRGKYQVVIEKKNKDASYSSVFASETIFADKGLINEKFVI